MWICRKDPKEIWAMTGVAESVQRKIMQHWRETGTVEQPSRDHRLVGQPRHLKAHDVAVSP